MLGESFSSRADREGGDACGHPQLLRQGGQLCGLAAETILSPALISLALFMAPFCAYLMLLLERRSLV